MGRGEIDAYASSPSIEHAVGTKVGACCVKLLCYFGFRNISIIVITDNYLIIMHAAHARQV